MAIVSEGLARRLWPGEDPLGKHIRIGSQAATRVSGEISPSSPSSEVIGIAPEVSNIAPTERDPAFLYLPKPPRDWDFSILLRYRGDRGAVNAAVLEEIRKAESRLPVSVETLEYAIANGEMAVAVRIAAMIFAAIGLIGFALASVGVYSMAGYTVSRQTPDVGIRMALGAGTWDVLRFLLADTVRWISIGVAAGAVLGIAISRVLSGIMQGLKLLDPLVLGGVRHHGGDRGTRRDGAGEKSGKNGSGDHAADRLIGSVSRYSCNTRPASIAHVPCLGLLGAAPPQIPQSARREDHREDSQPAEHPEGPHEEKAVGGIWQSRRGVPPSCALRAWLLPSVRSTT